MANILFENEVMDFELDDELWKDIHALVEAVLTAEDFFEGAEVSLTFVDNDSIQHLNSTYRGKDQPTDVLSFPMYERLEIELMPKAQQEYAAIGDIVISVQRAREQAEEYGHSFRRELCFLIVHSMFHLLGYDHDTPENIQVMRKKEEEILQALGIGRSS